MEQQLLGPAVEGAFVVQSQGLNSTGLESALGYGLGMGAPKGVFSWKWFSLAGGKVPREQATTFWSLDDLTWDGRSAGVPETTMASQGVNTTGGGARLKTWGQNTIVRQPSGSKRLWESVGIPPFTFEALRGKKMDSQNTGWLGTGMRARRGKSSHIGSAGAGPKEVSIFKKGLGCKVPEVKQIISVGLGVGLLQ
jgi:hypothetical protein